ncbi:PLAC8 family domain containing protein [Nitzschia inconspicua]|uniref:PLAC8 family domain containing protein n=1 Tax=Nitzschia inconspicua TaxID=303405 RepID=A0A9K3KXX3_9STRA|nr:PLAC8 family domain containing protein [Nitzschia inconspicua]
MYWDAGNPLDTHEALKPRTSAVNNGASPHRFPNGMLSESRAESVSKNSSLSGVPQREPVPMVNVPSPSHQMPSPYNTTFVGGGATFHTAMTPRSQVLDLKRNDNSFHVIAKLIIDRFEDQLSTHASTITVTAGDRFHLDRVVPAKRGFVEAVQYRLANCPEDSTKPIHLVTRQCRALGLHLDGDQNLLYAPVGTIVNIDWSDGSLHAGVDSVQNARPSDPDDLARQQLLAELREASNLMAESVTPEASKFWRKHVLELQAKLRALHEKSGMENRSIGLGDYDTADRIRNNDRLFASLWENTGYVPPKQEDMMSNISISNTNSIVESRSPSIQQHSRSQKPRQQRQSVAAALSDPGDMELPMVDVVAPADLPGGYQFEAEIDNKHFLATVPAGGVSKGQTFTCHMREMKETDIPVGRWRDGFFDCFRYGFTHPMLLNSLLCPLLALSQVESRLGLDVMGRQASPDTPKEGIWSTRGMMISVLVFWACLNTMIISGFEYKLHNYVSPSPADIISLVLVNGGLIFFAVNATVNTRAFLREKYRIGDDEKKSRARDIVSAIFCMPLSIAQMGRHTTSYTDYQGACCNDTGLAQPQPTETITV